MPATRAAAAAPARGRVEPEPVLARSPPVVEEVELPEVPEVPVVEEPPVVEPPVEPEPPVDEVPEPPVDEVEPSPPVEPVPPVEPPPVTSSVMAAVSFALFLSNGRDSVSSITEPLAPDTTLLIFSVKS